MMIIRLLCCVLCFMVLHSPTVRAQISVVDLNLNEGIETWYNQTIGREHTPIAEGTYYKIQSQTVLEHQFFESAAWKEGFLIIENQSFNDIRMLYNTFQDLLIVDNSGMYRSSYPALQPNQKKITQFTIGESLFLNLQSQEPPYGKGFYQVVYQGDQIRLLAKRIKTSSVGPQSVEYDEADILFIQVGSSYYKFRNKKSLYDIFPAHKNDIKKFIKSNLTYMNLKDETDLATVLDYCESLVPSL
ncbi:hypothetical protein N6H18_00320 [Reichenbachiella agarivorans]|uniref:GLPGLI family protein n=1 Tax=Reichenbachiella agarivorans TaxID=2979464 RepID=A0ABY6CPW7_9BACT|nr:hypothetical protein [Reichenbachiella agarivorans]UXP32419.1 hypothetical protein N6H18_00320 [Reichenbachiella agarivorans]